MLDPELEVWRLYGNRGWPGRYLFDRRGYLRYIHYGEGDYLDAERAIGEVLGELDEDFQAPPPAGADPARGRGGRAARSPRRPTWRCRPSAERLELVRDWTDGEDWIEAADSGAAASVTFDAGRSLGRPVGHGRAGPLRDGRDRRGRRPGDRLHGFQFTPRAP